MKWSDSFQTEELFSIDADSHNTGHLPSGGKVNILVDTTTSKSFMSTSFYPSHSYLTTLCKFTDDVAIISGGK